MSKWSLVRGLFLVSEFIGLFSPLLGVQNQICFQKLCFSFFRQENSRGFGHGGRRWWWGMGGKRRRVSARPPRFGQGEGGTAGSIRGVGGVRWVGGWGTKLSLVGVGNSIWSGALFPHSLGVSLPQSLAGHHFPIPTPLIRDLNRGSAVGSIGNKSKMSLQSWIQQ